MPEVLAYNPPDTGRLAAERAARTLNRRVAPPAVQAAAVKTVKVKPVVKPAKPGAKPAVKSAKPVAKSAPKTEAVAVAASGRGAAALAYAKRQIGKPYIWASAGPNGFDCSGLAVASYRAIGISLPHQTTPLARVGRKVSQSQLMPGDLVFPSSSHVGIYAGNGMMIHAPKPGDHVKLAKVYAFYTARRIVG